MQIILIEKNIILEIKIYKGVIYFLVYHYMTISVKGQWFLIPEHVLQINNFNCSKFESKIAILNFELACPDTEL